MLLKSLFAGAAGKETEAPDQLQTARWAEAEQDYLTGLGRLQQAQNQQFLEKSTLLGAYRHLATAVQKNRREPRYQTGLAYLLLLVGNFQRATHYVHQALKLAPQDERAQLLLEQIQRIQTASPARLRLATWQALENGPLPAADEDYDRIYEELESFMVQEVRLLMQEPVSPEPSVDLQQGQEQARYLELLEAFEALVGPKLDLLDAEIETQNLRSLLAPLQLLRNRLELALERHTQFHLLLDGIEGAREDVRVCSSWLENGESVPAEDIEYLLDLCDELADQIDELAGCAGVRPVEARYERLVAELSRLQDQLEGF